MMINRLALFIDKECISIRRFEETIGASNGLIRKAIAKNTDIQSKWISSIVDNYPHLNIYWLLTGNGAMYNDGRDNNQEVDKNSKEYIEGELQKAFDTFSESAAESICSQYSKDNNVDFNFNSFSKLRTKSKNLSEAIVELQTSFENQMLVNAQISLLVSSQAMDIDESESNYIKSLRDKYTVINNFFPIYKKLSKYIDESLDLLKKK